MYGPPMATVFVENTKSANIMVAMAAPVLTVTLTFVSNVISFIRERLPDFMEKYETYQFYHFDSDPRLPHFYYIW